MNLKFAGYLAVFIGGIVACYLLISLGVVDRIDGIPGTQTEPTLSLPTYLSFLSVMLTAVTVVLAAVAVFVGAVAAFTFKELSERAEQAAQKRADLALSDEVIKARINEVAFSNQTSKSLDELEEDFDPNDSGER